MINFTQSFYFRGHLCISTELLGMNLYEFIKAHDFKGFSLRLIRRFTKQMLSALVLLQSQRVIHCDLKPENILLAHPLHSEIKVIDFGSSCFENEKVYTYIQSRFYRSPEVILGMSYGMPIDMWSLGCILAELLTGYPIFPGENEQEQLACIMEIFGPPEKHLIEKSSRKKLFFDSLGKPRVTVSSKGRRRRPSSKTLQQALKIDDEAFLDFIARCLRWDPERRMRPDEAMQHEFITQAKRSMPVASRPPRSVQANGSLAASTASRSGGEQVAKRVNTTAQTPQRPRPLPEPPQTSFKTSNVPISRETSPIKAAGAPPRRHSTIHSIASSAGTKRASNGAAIIGSIRAAGAVTGNSTQQDSQLSTVPANTNGERVVSSGLPRVAQRAVSGPGGATGNRQAAGGDLASAAAIASLVSTPVQIHSQFIHQRYP
jgi:dual specificity tyrosine-phosphorylation-regulated kinase 2/3/4